MSIRTSVEKRNDQLFLRNGFKTHGKYNFSLIKKQAITLDDIELIACSDAKYNDRDENKMKGVHFFVDDYRFENVYNNPDRTLGKYSQYRFLLSPDFSMYAEMNSWRQIESVAKNRWCGAFWQEHGLIVIPTISWSDALSYDFCFDGVEQKSVVAIGMIGCKTDKRAFMSGYNEMLNRIHPEAVICFGTPFQEMQGNLIPVDYMKSRKVVR